jgi:hypothetical protein
VRGNRTGSGWFKKGQSGNPSGRAKNGNPSGRPKRLPEFAPNTDDPDGADRRTVGNLVVEARKFSGFHTGDLAVHNGRWILAASYCGGCRGSVSDLWHSEWTNISVYRRLLFCKHLAAGFDRRCDQQEISEDKGVRKKRGWLGLAFDNFLFELRPTLTENQKIQKIAGRELRLLETQQIRAYREAKRRARVQRQQMAEKAAQDRSRDRAHQRMVKDVRRLEQKFGQVGGLYFNYSNVGIEIYRGGVGARVGELIARVRCYGTPTSFAYDLEMAEWFAAKKGETFSSERPMMQYLRKALRQAAAETVARRAAAQRSHDAASRGGQSRGAMRS